MSYHRAMSCKREFLINAIRNELNLENPHVWAAVHTLVSSAEAPRMRVGDLYPCLGPFHWCRVLLKCQGKLLRGTGIDDALIECEVFGPIVLDTALNGHHYARALTGMLIVEDVMMRLLWKAFWNIKEKHDYLVTSAL